MLLLLCARRVHPIRVRDGTHLSNSSSLAPMSAQTLTLMSAQMMQVEGSVLELYSFMDAANSTLDAALEEDPSSLSPSGSLRAGSLPPSLKATPRSLPSEVSCSMLLCILLQSQRQHR